MSDSIDQAPGHEAVYATFCGPRFKQVDADLKEVKEEVQEIRTQAIAEQGKIALAVERLRGKLENGLSSKVASIDMMQKWQLGLLTAIFLAVAGAVIAKVF